MSTERVSSMKKFDFSNGIVVATEWISRLAIANLMWLLCSLPIITLIPATNALFRLFYLWSKGEDTPSTAKTFWDSFKKVFWNSYKGAGLVWGVLVVLLLDSWILTLLAQTQAWLHIYKYVLYMTTFLFSLTALYYFPLSKKLSGSGPKQLLTAFWLMIGHPVLSLLLAASCMLLVIILLRFPALLFFFSGTGLAGLATMFTNKAIYHSSMRKKKKLPAEY
ncbi:MAG: DUF624 domain-containing protein [Desemzia incerta]